MVVLWEPSESESLGPLHPTSGKHMIHFSKAVTLKSLCPIPMLPVPFGLRGAPLCTHNTHCRFVFAHAYAEVRYIVEANLMKKFVASAGFKAAALLTGTTGEGYTGPIIVRPEPDEV